MIPGKTSCASIASMWLCKMLLSKCCQLTGRLVDWSMQIGKQQAHASLTNMRLQDHLFYCKDDLEARLRHEALHSAMQDDGNIGSAFEVVAQGLCAVV